MNVFKKIREIREKAYNYRLKRAKEGAVSLEVQAEKEKALADVIKRQNEAKQQISNARRETHPLLYKLGDNFKNKLAQAKENKNKSSFGNSTIFQNQKQADVPYWLKSSSKQSTSPFLNNKKADVPYWLKTTNKKRK